MPTLRKRDIAFGNDGRSVEAQIRKKSRLHLSLAERAISNAKEILEGAQFGDKELQKIVAAQLLARLILAAQAGVLLTLRGLDHDAAIGVRSAFEVYVRLKGCAQSLAFCKEFLNADLVRVRKLLGAQDPKRLSAKKRAAFSKRLKSLDAEIAKRAAKELKVEQVSRAVGLSGEYNTVYRMTSSAAHCSPGILQDFLKVKNKKVSSIQAGPSAKNADVYLFTLASFLHYGTGAFALLVGAPPMRKWSRLESDLKRSAPA